MSTFRIPDDFRAFMKSVVVYLETPTDDMFLDAEDALDSECGYGGRIDGVDTYRFKYITNDGHHRWDVVLKEAQVRDIADGLLIEAEGERFDIVRTSRRTPVGEPLLIWGGRRLKKPGSARYAMSAQDLQRKLHDAAAPPDPVRDWTGVDPDRAGIRGQRAPADLAWHSHRSKLLAGFCGSQSATATFNPSPTQRRRCSCQPIPP